MIAVLTSAKERRAGVSVAQWAGSPCTKLPLGGLATERRNPSIPASNKLHGAGDVKSSQH